MNAVYEGLKKIDACWKGIGAIGETLKKSYVPAIRNCLGTMILCADIDDRIQLKAAKAGMKPVLKSDAFHSTPLTFQIQLEQAMRKGETS